MLGLLFLGVFFIIVPRYAAAEPAVDPVKLLKNSYEAAKKIKDFTATLTKQEQIKGKLRPQETMKIKFRQKPFSVYLKWIKPHTGRELIYVEGQNDGKMVAHQPVGPLNFGLKLDPNSPNTQAESRRKITDAGFENAMGQILELTQLAQKRGDLCISYLGTETFDNRPVDVVVRLLPKRRKEYNIYMLVLYIDKGHKIPVKIASYDRDMRMLGLYTYRDVKINVGLRDIDFDVRNPEYDFPGILPLTAPKLPWPFEEEKEQGQKK